MKIGIEFYGICNKYPCLMKIIMRKWNLLNHTVIIISGPPFHDIMHEIYTYKYKHEKHFNGISSIVDYLKRNNTNMYIDYSTETWWSTNEIWLNAKKNICFDYNIDYIIDTDINCLNRINFNRTKTTHISGGWDIIKLLFKKIKL